MKKTACFALFCLLLSFSTFAQDWNLVDMDTRYNFLSPQDNFVSHTLGIENIGVDGADSIFLVYPPKAIFLFDYPYVGMVGNILGDSLIKHPGSVYECRFEQPLEFDYPLETTIIHTKAEPGASWEFKPGVTATVSEKKDTVCWGFADSLKIISLSDGKTIRLSKRFGVLALENQTLVGLQGKNIGTQLPGVSTFYSDWVNGAVFEHFGTYKYSYTSHTQIWTKYYVQGNTGAPGSGINVRKLVRRELYNYSTLDTVIFEDKQDVFTIPGPDNLQPGISTGSFTPYTSTYYRNTPQGLELTVQSFHTPSSGGPTHRKVYVAGIGRTNNEFLYSYPGLYSNIVENMPGYRKVGQPEQGTIHPDSFFGITSSSQEVSDVTQLTVYPNPAGSMVFIQCDDCPQAETVEWMDLSGKVLKTVQNPVFQTPIEVNDLPKGLYLLRIRMAGNYIAVRKVVVF